MSWRTASNCIVRWIRAVYIVHSVCCMNMWGGVNTDLYSTKWLNPIVYEVNRLWNHENMLLF